MDEIIRKFSQIKVGIIGDAILDIFSYYSYERPSREVAKTDIISFQTETVKPGGAANVAANIVTLGGKSYLITVMGKDFRSDDLMKTLIANNINVLGIYDIDRPTSRKERIFRDGKLFVTLAKEKKKKISLAVIRQTIETLYKVSCDALIISDYGRGMICRELLYEISQWAHEKQKRIFVDIRFTGFYDWRDLKNIYLAKPNIHDLLKFYKIPKGEASCEVVEKLSRKLVKEIDVHLLVTMGKKGMMLATRDGAIKYFNAQTRTNDVVYVSGAGDAVIATVTLAQTAGATLEEATKLAVHASGIAVKKPHTAPVSQSELLQEIAKFKTQIEIGDVINFKRK